MAKSSTRSTASERHGSSPTLEIEPLAHGFGATVTGLDLRAPVTPEQAEAIHAAWARHAVLVFPGQCLAPEELEAFTLALGKFGEDPFIAPMPGHPNILEIRREADETVQNFGAAWHSDWSFQPSPPAGTILHSKIVPPVGGDTLYADTARAHDALSPTMQQMLDGLHAIHSASFAYGPRGVLARDADKRTIKVIVSEEAEKTERHPLVRIHPVTGRKALFVTPRRTIRTTATACSGCSTTPSKGATTAPAKPTSIVSPHLSVDIIDQCVAQGVPFAREYGGLWTTARSAARKSPARFTPGPNRPATAARRLSGDDAAGGRRQGEALHPPRNARPRDGRRPGARHRDPQPRHGRDRDVTLGDAVLLAPAATATSTTSRPTPRTAT